MRCMQGPPLPPPPPRSPTFNSALSTGCMAILAHPVLTRARLSSRGRIQCASKPSSTATPAGTKSKQLLQVWGRRVSAQTQLLKIRTPGSIRTTPHIMNVTTCLAPMGRSALQKPPLTVDASARADPSHPRPRLRPPRPRRVHPPRPARPRQPPRHQARQR